MIELAKDENMNVRLENIVKKFGSQTVVNHIDLEIRTGELLLLLGPSGCGKTTVLRMLAGFCEPDEGRLLFGSNSMTGVPPQKRSTAMVFQNYALWPHLTVFENVAYGLRVRRRPREEIQQRVDEALGLVRMSEYRDRKPTQLSGGQQQRVALARAFVVRPELLLFDEPLCNLDPQLRMEMRLEIKRLQTTTGITSLYVTHDQEEALSLADRIAVMHQGVIQQIDTPFNLYNRPATPFVARFIGEINLYDRPASFSPALHQAPGETIGFRPENVRLLPNGQEAGIRARVVGSTYLGSKFELILQTAPDEEIKAWTPDGIETGREVDFRVPEDKVLRFRAS